MNKGLRFAGGVIGSIYVQRAVWDDKAKQGAKDASMALRFEKEAVSDLGKAGEHAEQFKEREAATDLEKAIKDAKAQIGEAKASTAHRLAEQLLMQRIAHVEARLNQVSACVCVGDLLKTSHLEFIVDLPVTIQGAKLQTPC